MKVAPTPLRASIDIGSNSLLLLIGYFDGQGKFVEAENLCEVTGLGKSIDDTGSFLPESMEETFKVLAMYRKRIIDKGLRPEDAIITATEASRVSQNSRSFFEKVKGELGLSVSIISAAGESYYSALGVCLGLSSTSSANNLEKSGPYAFIMDVGGASTEIIKVCLDPFSPADFISLPMGSVRALEWARKNSLEESLAGILKGVEGRLRQFKTSNLICIAGTMTSLANISLGHASSYDDGAVHGTTISDGKFSALLETLKAWNVDELGGRFPFLGKRAPTLVSGGMVAHSIGRALGVRSYQISVYGARYGTLYEGKVQDGYIHKFER